MKRTFLSLILSLGVLYASAEIRYHSINNIRGTNIVLLDRNAPQKVEITEAVLYNDGETYPAKQIRGCLKTIVNGSEFSESDHDSSNHKHFIG